jgi:tetratricopeptide (TPR) repeat protein
LLALLLLGLVVRGAYLLDIYRATPLVRHLFLDARYHDAIARKILSGEGVGPYPYRLSPLYPYFLAVVYSCGGGLLAVRILQSLFGAFSGPLIFLLLRRRVAPVAAAAAGVLGAVYGPAVYFDGSILVEGPNAVLILAATWTAMRGLEEGRLRWSVATGYLLGHAAALRPTALLMAFLLAAAGLARKEFPRWRWAMALLATCFIVIAPFTLRNLLVSGQPVLLSANGGFNFYVGNDPGSTGLWSFPEGIEELHDPLGGLLLERELGRSLSDQEASWIWFRRAIRRIQSDPGGWLRLLGRKLLFIFHPREIPQQGLSQAWFRRLSRVLALLPGFACVAPLALIGLLGLRRPREWTAPLLAVVSQVVPQLLFFTIDRYRLPLAMLLIVFAGLGFDTLVRAFRERRRVELLSWAAVGLVAVLGMSVVYSRPGLRLNLTPIFEEYHTGLAFLEEGRLKEAEAAFRRALELEDSAVIRLGLANCLKQAGRLDEAEAEYLRAMALDPRDPDAAFNLGNLYLQQRGEPLLAEQLYLEALRRREYFPEAHLNLGLLYDQVLGRPEDALRELRRYLELEQWNLDRRALVARRVKELEQQLAAARSP